MAQQISYSTTIRNNRLTQLLNAIDAGAGAGLLRIYDSTRPSNGGTATPQQRRARSPSPSLPPSPNDATRWRQPGCSSTRIRSANSAKSGMAT